MRIISEFHDYYDAVQSQGQDQTVVWVRKTEEQQFSRRRNDQLPEYPFPVLTQALGYLWRGETVSPSQYIVGFCGKIYPLLRLSVRFQEAAAFCYTMEEVDAFMEEHLDKKAKDEYYRTKGVGKWYQRKTPGKRKDYLEFFDQCRQKQERFEQLFREHHSPVFVASISRYKAEITYNAPLREYEFYRMFDVYTAFQEIAMYYGGVLGGVREHVPDVSDKDLAEAKGFNKWSFRKPPKT